MVSAPNKCAHPSRGIKPPGRMIESGNDLGGRQIVPGLAFALQLEHSAFIRVEEIISIGDPVSILRANHAARPTGWRHASPVLLLWGNHMDAVIHAILDSRGPSRNQTSASVALLSSHSVYDAPEAFLVPLQNAHTKSFVYSWLPRLEAKISMITPFGLPDLEQRQPLVPVTSEYSMVCFFPTLLAFPIDL
jgi:hypothetical protein